MPQTRLTITLILSLLLHTAILGIELLPTFSTSQAPRSIQAHLYINTKSQTSPSETLLKNTLVKTDSKQEHKPSQATPPPSTASTQTTPGLTQREAVQAAQRKIAEHNYYPIAAIEQGIEGDVRLILKLTPEGHIKDVQIGVSSGHTLLDNAAIQAAYAAGQIPGANSREMIITVTFRFSR